MPLFPVWTVMMVAGMVMILTTTTTTLAAPKAPHFTLCPNITTDQLDFVNNTDGCVVSAYKHLEPQENNRTKIKTIHYHDIFCINRACPARLTYNLYTEGGGCVALKDFLEGLMEKNAPYIFCGRFIGNNNEEMALTAMPVSYSSGLENALYNKYASITELHPPSVEVRGAWQRDTSVEPHVYYVEENTTLTMTCNYDHTKPLTLGFTWSNQTHNISARKVIEKQFKLPGSAIYECRVRLSNARYSEPCQLNITVIAKDATYLTTKILDRSVTEVEKNQPVQWRVRFIAHPKPEFQWKKQGKLLLDSRIKKSRDQLMNHQIDVTVEEASLTLSLYHATLADNGKYTLEAFLPGTNITTTTTMFLMLPDEDSLAPIALRLEIDGEERSVVGNIATVLEGDDFKLTCRANKVTAEAPLTWTLNDIPLDQATRKTWDMEVTDHDTLLSFVSTVSSPRLPRSAGNFSIGCADQAGDHTALVISVQEMVKPVWRGEESLGKDYVMNKDDNLTLSCPADGIPRPKIIWKKGEELVQENNWRKIRNNYELFFVILSSSDTGKYTCEISNRAGHLAVSFNVTVRDPYQEAALILAIAGVFIAALVAVSVFLASNRAQMILKR